MPWFAYRALTPGGVLLDGRIQADDHAGAQAELARMNVEVRELEPAEAPPVRRAGISADDLIFFNQQVASFARAGIPLDEGLAQLARDIDSPRLRRWIEALLVDIRAGVPLEEAFARNERGLPVFYSAVIKAGIANGELASTLLNLNQQLGFAASLRRVWWESLTYPLVIAVAALGLVSFFMLMVVPQFRSVLDDFDMKLPVVTLYVLRLADVFPMLLGAGAVIVVALGLLWMGLAATAAGRSFRQRLLLRIPLLAPLLRHALLARFFRAASIAVANGLPLPDALRLSAGATGHSPLMGEADTLAAEVERGASLTEATSRTRLIPPLFGLCVQTATGRDATAQAIDKLAATHENRARHNEHLVRTLLQPFFILCLGLFMGILIIALFLPLASLIRYMSGGGL